MLVKYISDIHTEFLSEKEIDVILSKITNEKILILSGDIGNPQKKTYKYFLKQIANKFEKVFLISGNHEYYHSEVAGNTQLIAETVKDIPNITFLHNSFEDYEGYRWIGTTLWSEITNPQFVTNDMNYIKKISVEKYNEMHFECVKFLEDTLTISLTENISSIVITHHLPISGLTDKEYLAPFYLPYSQMFNSNLDSLVEKYSKVITGWFYGHTHKKSIQKHYDVTFYCNPVGYVGENSVIDWEGETHL